MRVGLFFGSFNPPHLGHLNAVYTILNSKYVDKVIVVPAFRNPWKEKETSSSPDKEFYFRYHLCNIIFEDLIKENKVMISDIEYHIWRSKHKYEDDVIYTYETLDEFAGSSEKEKILNFFNRKENENIEYVFTTTVETFATIKNWMNGPYILSSQKFLLLSTDDLMKRISDENKENLYGYPIITYKGIDVHSTDIRNQLKVGKNPLPYISCKAYKYIIENKKDFAI